MGEEGERRYDSGLYPRSVSVTLVLIHGEGSLSIESLLTIGPNPLTGWGRGVQGTCVRLISPSFFGRGFVSVTLTLIL